MQAVLTGQAVPVATKGTFLFATGAWVADGAAVTAGASIYASGDGQVTPTLASVNTKVGKALGGPDSDGAVLVKLEL